jgi:transposase
LRRSSAIRSSVDTGGWPLSDGTLLRTERDPEGSESERPITHIAADLGIHSETLSKRVRQAEADSGARPELTSSSEREELKRLRRENCELRRANEILKSASVFFQGARLRPTEVTAFIDEQRGRFGVEPICRVLACRRPRTTNAPPASAALERSTTSGCFS